MASEELAKLLEAHPNEPAVLKLHASVLGNVEKNPGAAQRILVRVTQIPPRDGDAWSLLGSFYLDSRRLEEGIRCFEKAASIDAANPLYRAGLARVLSLPVDRSDFSSDIINSYRVKQGVLHNPKSDRRTTEGIFHIVEGGLPVPADKLAAACVMLVLLGLAFGSIALAISAATGNRGAAIGVAVGLMVVSYLIDGLANIIEGLNSIRWISPFKYYMGGDPLRNGLSIPDAGVLGAVAVVFLVLAVIAFERRDLAA